MLIFLNIKLQYNQKQTKYKSYLFLEINLIFLIYINKYTKNYL